jgi:hypothetical protein
MKVCAKCKQEKPVDSFYRYSRSKDGYQSYCKVCTKEKTDAFAKTEERKEYLKKYRQDNRDKINERKVQYRKENRGDLWEDRHKDEVRKYKSLWARSNKQKVKESQNKYRLSNLPKYANHRAKSRAAKIQATPAWLTEEDKKAMESLYTLAKKLEAVTGFPMEVDHIVPLQGKNFCGLHTPTNLQLLARPLNRSKGNRLKGGDPL